MRTIEQRAAEFSRIFQSSTRDAWRYYTAGRGDTVLLLPGSVGIGISWVDLALALQKPRGTRLSTPHERPCAPPRRLPG